MTDPKITTDEKIFVVGESIFHVTLTLTNNVLASPMPNELLTAKQAAQYLGVHVETLRRWVRLGTIPRTPLPGAGKDYRFSRRELEQWRQKRTIK